MQELRREAVSLPTIVAERCVHSLLATASCTACVDACPREAWVLNDEQLGIDAARCDGCKLCAPACPQGAVQAEISPELRRSNQGVLALLACVQSGVQAGPGVEPCLHACSYSLLTSLVHAGVTEIVACCAHCDHCERGVASRIEDRIAQFNVLLSNRKLPRIQYRAADPSEWSDLRSSEPLITTAETLTRRQFFSRTTQAMTEAKSQLDGVETPDTAGFEPPGCILPNQSPGHLVLFLPQIDPLQCNACGACLKLCPNHVITLQNPVAAYHIEPDRCTGCGVCRDVCDQGAISVLAWAVPQLLDIPLAGGRCHDCGAPYFTPVAQSSADQLCRICAGSRNKKLLYQVFD